MRGSPTIFVMAIVAVIIWPSVVYSGCLDYDYAPCECFDDPTFKIGCYNVTVEDVQRVFGRAPASEFDYWNSIQWFLSNVNSNVTLPAGLLGNVTFKNIEIHCRSTSTRLTLDRDAFRSSATVAQRLYLYFCNLNQQTDYAFVDGFEHLNDFLILGSTNIPNFSKLPRYLPELYALELPDNTMVEDSSGASYTLNFPKLGKLWLSGSKFDDRTVANLVDAILPVSADTVRFLDLSYNQLTRVPDNVPHSFTNLDEVHLEQNHIRSLSAGSIDYSLANADDDDPGSYHRTISLQYTELDYIAPGAFQGNFSHMYVDLGLNNLTTFEQEVYREMLEGMSHRPPSSSVELSMRKNPIDCDGCGLAWLIRDNRHLLDYVYGATCANGSKFEELDPNGFGECNNPITEPTVEPTGSASEQRQTVALLVLTALLPLTRMK